MLYNRKFKEEYCEMLIDHMAKGYSFESFAGVIGVARSTVYNWKNKYPEFKDAMEVASAKCQVFWEGLGIEGVFTDKLVTFNATTWIFNMKNRFDWKDKSEVDQTNRNINIVFSKDEENL